MAAQCETIGDDVASMDLFDEKGDVVKFGDLYGERKALVVFIRVSHVTKTSLRLVQLDCSIFCDMCAKNTSKVEAQLHIQSRRESFFVDLGRVPKENFEVSQNAGVTPLLRSISRRQTCALSQSDAVRTNSSKDFVRDRVEINK